ncbi:hypothetical protein ASG50_15320 [Rhizobium sp. Leaf386]|nr:hypothetical protein ASG50_15320 [Rhizobium sp. Leaf386]
MGLIGAWMSAISLFGADVVVADHSPTALIAARILGIPSVVLGTGFEIPPSIAPCPSIMPWAPVSSTILEKHHSLAVANINISLRAHRHSPIVSVASLFSDVPILVSGFSELDHYGSRSGVLYLGPLGKSRASSEVKWPEREGLKVFVYLHGDISIVAPTLDALERIGVNAICVLPSVGAHPSSLIESQNIKVFEQLVDTDSILPDADIVISNAGSGLMAEALLRGVPLLLLPIFAEQSIGARRAVDLEAARMLSPAATAIEIEAALMNLSTAPSFRQAAKRFKERYKDYNVQSAVKRAAAEIVQAARGQS